MRCIVFKWVLFDRNPCFKRLESRGDDEVDVKMVFPATENDMEAMGSMIEGGVLESSWCVLV